MKNKQKKWCINATKHDKIVLCELSYIEYSCPLPGSLHFYQKPKQNWKNWEVCLCPLTGSLHFYERKSKEWDWCYWSVNALSRALSISTMPDWILWAMYQNSVNALSRALSISTLPSGNSMKWGVCSVIFACNCLTI